MTITTQIGHCNARKMMIRFCEASNECSFYFLASLIKNLQLETVSESYYLKPSQPIFLKCLFILA